MVQGTRPGLRFFSWKAKHCAEWRELLDVIDHITAARLWQVGRCLHARLEAGILTYNALASGFARFTRWQQSLQAACHRVLLRLQPQVLTSSLDSGANIDGASYGAAVGACQKRLS